MNIETVIEFLFPNGTTPSGILPQEGPRILPLSLCPLWPTDVFATVATLIEKTGLLHFSSPNQKQSKQLGQQNLRKIATEWRTRLYPPQVVQKSWSYMFQHKNVLIDEIKNRKELLFHLHFLFKCADETANGLGWGIDKLDSIFDIIILSKLLKEPDNPFRKIVRAFGSEFQQWVPPNIPQTFCHMIPPQRAVVAPKTISAEVGYTIRSLSHHLALLEPQPKLKISWYSPEGNAQNTEFGKADHYNILFIPFPFRMAANAVLPYGPPQNIGSNGKKYGYFKLDPTWLPKEPDSNKKHKIQAKKLYADLIKPLLEKAREHSKFVDCIVLPECAMTESVADEVAKILSEKEFTEGLCHFVTGAISENTKSKQSQNKALTYFLKESVAIKHGHTKHHRWKLDVTQNKRYGFSSFPADTNTDWWEYIDVSDRHLPFYAIRHHACMTVLVCEDLARNDPALPAVRAIGPNLVIALLMDGPQISARWPSRYATVLAEDPGSAILSVTSAAMVDRSNRSEANGVRSVALWKHHTGQPQPLVLSKGDHGFLLSLGATYDEQITMDNRVDGCNTRRFELMGVESLKVDNAASWL